MIHLKPSGKRKLILQENLFCSKHKSLTIKHNQHSSKQFHDSLGRSICPPLFRNHQMYKVVSYGGTVLHFYHKAHKPSVHMPLDLLFAMVQIALVQVWFVGIFLESGLSLEKEKSCDQKGHSHAALRACSCQFSLQAVVMSFSEMFFSLLTILVVTQECQHVLMLKLQQQCKSSFK